MAERAATLKAEQETGALKSLQAAAGFSQGNAERLDWMYEQSALQKKDADELMNMAVASEKDKDLEDVKKLGENTAGSLFLKSATKTTEDMLRKLREDPLFQIRRQEQAARENMMANPLILAKVQKKAMKAAKKEDKKHKKAAKKEKKALKKAKKQEKKARKKAASSSSSSSSSAAPAAASSRGAAAPRPAAAGRGEAPRRRSRSRSPKREKCLGPSVDVVDKRAEREAEIAARRDAALASRHATKRMGSEERRKRLEQMRSDANTHERSKDKRIADAEKKDREIEEKEGEMRKSLEPKFAKGMREEIYMGDAKASLEKRMQNQRHRRQKNLNDPLERDG